uniref:Endo-1,4-beta-xylanase A n=1 Tax=Lygus hesperus TaxID=30085 RepID=A0A0A9WE71_LYGHE
MNNVSSSQHSIPLSWCIPNSLVCEGEYTGKIFNLESDSVVFVSKDLRQCSRNTYMTVSDTYSFEGVKTSRLDRGFNPKPEVQYYINEVQYSSNYIETSNFMTTTGFFGIGFP